MAYTKPRTWAHGDQLDATATTDLQAYSDSQDTLNGLITPAKYFMMVSSRHLNQNNTTVQHRIGFVHMFRWLRYKNDVSLVSPYPTLDVVIYDLSTGNDPVTLPESSSAVGVYDLLSITWITVGGKYVIDGAKFAAESQLNA